MAGKPGYPVEVRRVFWQAVRSGAEVKEAAAGAGVSETSAKRWVRDRGGVIPSIVEEPTGRRLCLAEREEIDRLNRDGHGKREIGRALGRAASTISRELRNGVERHKTGYLASVAQRRADERARRPKEPRLVANPRLREEVQSRLRDKHSPEQISRRLAKDFPDEPQMQVCHETIYQAIFVHARGGLRRELAECLRTGRAMRKPRRGTPRTQGRIRNMVHISDRPDEVAERRVPGHWEGDLIVGKEGKSAIGTLVERVTSFTILLHLPDGHGAEQVQAAMLQAMDRLTAQLAKTVTWDQGKEMANHAQITEASGVQIYFCDPHSPWQRPSNENTNGLLRQYFPKGTDLSGYHPDYLEFVENQLNDRPRKRLDWQTPKEKLRELLFETPDPPGVAGTG